MLALRPLAITLVLAIAAASLSMAMAVYPGGSASSPTATTFVPWRDYFCDLLAATTATGHDNTLGMACARLGMLLTAAALWLMWRDCAIARPWPGRHRAIRIAGTCAALAMPAVAWSPSGEWPLWHSVAILLAGVPGGLAIALTGACAWQRRRERPRTALLTFLFGLAGVAVAVTWTLCFVATWPAVPLAIAQKLAWLLLIAWTVAVAHD